MTCFSQRTIDILTNNHFKRDVEDLGLTETHEIIPDASSGTSPTPSKGKIGTPIDRFILQKSICTIPNRRSTLCGAVGGSLNRA